MKNYDKNGIEALKSDYSKCGAESKLTDEQLKELFEILIVKKQIKDLELMQLVFRRMNSLIDFLQ